LGEVVRLCLHQGATPVFIPQGEPWRNGVVEHYNDTFDKRFFRSERFGSREVLRARADSLSRTSSNISRRVSNGGNECCSSSTSSPRSPTAHTSPG
ncbi:MAG: hypothetical protein ACRDN8_22060, partial [Thermoleophilaceae bacterium]